VVHHPVEGSSEEEDAAFPAGWRAAEVQEVSRGVASVGETGDGGDSGLRGEG